MEQRARLITAHEPISYAYFPLSGLVTVVTDAVKAPIGIGLIGREGMTGLPAVLGSDSAPHHYVVQISGSALRIGMRALLIVLRERPSLFRPFGLFAHVFTTQVGQTACANVNLTTRARLARWLLMAQDRLEGGEIALTHEALAVMLGVQRPRVTEAIHGLEGKRLIQTRRGRIAVRERDRLLDLVGVSYGLAEAEYERLFPQPELEALTA